jgi:hyperosmotically inducible periplasmic protein
MRYATMMAVATVAALVAAPVAAPAQTLKDQARNTLGQAKDRVEGATEKATTAVKDRWITAKTKIALFADERVQGREVHVDTENGVIALRGNVESGTARDAAVAIAKGIEGARAVRNELRVVSATPPRAVRPDHDLAQAVRSRLSQEANLRTVQVRGGDGGVVTLTGEATDIDAAARASELARGVPGVTAVKNDLTVLQTK